MKIIYKRGNLLNTSYKLIAHGCNAQGVMGSGVAKLIKERYPIVFKAYRLKYQKDGLKLGTILPVYIGNKKWVINCITQEFYGKSFGKVYVSYEAIKQCMLDINKKFSKNYAEIALPMIGAGLGGGGLLEYN